jgi:nucleoside-diphosphate-sugar epimerase
MKILITGATGFIGSHLADLLKSEGNEIYCTVRKSSNLRWLENKGFHLIESDFKDNSDNKELFEKMDFVYHLAGLTSAKDYDGYLKGNRDLTKDILELVSKYSKNLKKFIYVSSQTASGPSKSLNNPVRESDICTPLTSYGKSKFEAEKEVVKFFVKIPVCIVRPPAVYGPRDTEILSVFKAVKMGIGTKIGFNQKFLSLIHVTDLINGIRLAGESEKSNGEIYFISSHDFYHWDELLDTMKAAFNKSFLLKLNLPHFLVLTIAAISGFFGKFSAKPPVFNYEKGIDFIQNYWTCSIDKAEKELGYKQQISIKEGFAETVKWYKENNWL